MKYLLNELTGVGVAGIALAFFLTSCSDSSFTENTSSPDNNRKVDAQVQGATGPNGDKTGSSDDPDGTNGTNGKNGSDDSFRGDRGAVSGGDSESGTGDSDGDIEDGSGGFARTQASFSLDVSEAPLDLVWVIDNSGSMRNEIEIVRNNLDNFIGSISDRVNLKLMLITQAGDDSREVNLSNVAKNEGHRQLDSRINSHSALVAAALASCPENTNAQNPETICNKRVDDFASVRFNEVSGRLTEEFRGNAKRVYVFVTDDEPEEVTDANFLQMVQPYAGDKEITTFGFVGLKKNGGCNIARVGDSYARLAQATGGAVFDICEPDWTAHFDKLAAKVVVLANATFELEGAEIAKVVKVQQGSDELNPSSYQLDGNKLTVDPEALSAEGGDVIVEYDYRG